MGEQAAYVEGQPTDEGRARPDASTEYLVEERFVLCHVWRTGDRLTWDNRCLLQRTCLRGAVPASAFPVIL